MVPKESLVIADRRVLMIAPEPVVRPRGTPLSILARLRALSSLGCRVDLVTWPFGEDAAIAGVTVVRCGAFPVRREPPIGPSAAKLVLDLHLHRATKRQLAAGAYDLVYTHEEAAFIGARLARRAGLPHLYEMHSSLPEQLANYGWCRRNGPAVRLARRLERRLLRRVDALIAVYPALADHVRRIRPNLPVVTIENPPLTYVLGEGVNREGPWNPGGFQGPSEIVLYTGNLARNQGIDLLLAAMAAVRERVPTARLVVIGGRPKGVARARRSADSLGLADGVAFRGRVSPAEALAAHREAAVLVSPRTVGANVPSKVYTYLAAGRPIVATDIPSHRAVLDDTCAVLLPPTPTGLADGLVQVLTDPALVARLSVGAAARAAERFDPACYVDRVRQALDAAVGSG